MLPTRRPHRAATTRPASDPAWRGQNPLIRNDSSRASELWLSFKMRRVIACLLARHDTDIRNVAILLRVVETVAHNELVWNFEAYIIALQREFPPGRFVEQCGDL